MKALLTITFLIVFLPGYSQNLYYTDLPLPKITDSIYLDETEITVQDWVYFLTDNIGKDNWDVNDFLPDTNKIHKNARVYFKPFLKENISVKEISPHTFKYFNQNIIVPDDYQERYILADVPMSSYPITGVSYSQVLRYCQWRTSLYNKIISSNKGIIMLAEINEVNVRLPTPEEFERFSRLSGSKKKKIKKKHFTNVKNPLGDTVISSKECSYLRAFNYNSQGIVDEYEANYGFGVYPVALYFSTFSNVYDWYGNVAEMTSKENIAKGGSYKHTAKASHPISNQYYSGPEEWLGFRCIIEIVETQ